MIQSFKILFLSISILFSLGFTTKQAVCDMDVNKEKICCESKKSCCTSEKETKDDCKKECCLKADGILILDNFFIDQNETKITNFVKKSILLPILLAKEISINKDDFFKNDCVFKPKILGRQILCYKQSWLI